MSAKQPAFDLRILNRVSRALAETRDLKKVKSLRDKADAARHYAKSAALGLQLQNFAAELKIQAERRAGEVLIELVTHGGDRRSSSSTGNLKLVDLGISHHQSALWRHLAAVPEAVFKQYVADANMLGREVTASGLLRFAKPMPQGRKRRSSAQSNCTASGAAAVRTFDAREPELCRNGTEVTPATCGTSSEDRAIRELLVEMANHRDLLAGILGPICQGHDDLAIPCAQRRVIIRVLQECDGLIRRLEQLLFGESPA